MHSTLSLETSVVAFLFASLLTVLYILWSWIPYANKNIKTLKRLPEAGAAWPIIGHFHLFWGSKLPHVELGCMADKYGPIFAIKLGKKKAIVVSDWKVAKECYSSKDKVFLNRPKSIGLEVMAYNYAMFGIGPYGPYWQKMRKITRELLTVHHIEMFEHLRISEIKESVADIYHFWLKNRSFQSHMVKIDINQWLGCLTQNIVLRTIVGKRYEWNDKKGIQFSERISTVTGQVGKFYLRDYVSALRWLDWGDCEKATQEAAKETDRILTEWLGEHKLRRKAKDEHHDIMDMILTKVDDATSQDFEGFDPDTVVKAASLTFISGAADATRIALTWVLFLLISNPHVLQKARDELNNHVGRNRQVEESDIEHLVYLQAIFKESMRLHPPSTLLPPRESIQDSDIGGYNIPKDTLLIANLSKIQRDPQVWPNPDEFQPERFLTSHQNVDVKGNHYELLPFGSGRRRCPGIFFGLRLMQIALATLIHQFELEKASDEADDKSATIGRTNFIPQFKILLKPITYIEK